MWGAPAHLVAFLVVTRPADDPHLAGIGIVREPQIGVPG